MSTAYEGNDIYNGGGGGSIDTSVFASKFDITDVTSSYTGMLSTGNMDVVHFKAYAYSLLNEDDNFLSMVGLRFELSAKYKTSIPSQAYSDIVVMNLSGIVNPIRLRVPVAMYNSADVNGQLDRDANFFLTNYTNFRLLAQEGNPDGNIHVCGYNGTVSLIGFAVCFDYLGARYI